MKEKTVQWELGWKEYSYLLQNTCTAQENRWGKMD